MRCFKAESMYSCESSSGLRMVRFLDAQYGTFQPIVQYLRYQKLKKTRARIIADVRSLCVLKKKTLCIGSVLMR